MKFVQTDYYRIMKVRSTLLAVAALLTPAFAAEDTNSLAGVPTISGQRLSGSLSVGYNTNYSGRGIVISHSVAEGDSSEYAALHLTYDVGAKSLWTVESTVAYTMVSSGHTLYGNPRFGARLSGMAGMQYAAGMVNAGLLDPADAGYAAAKYASEMRHRPIKQANIENEFAVVTALKYTQKYWNVSFGHDFIHGGLLGVMAKHYRDQGASCVNEVFITPMVTPAPWVEAGVTTRFSFQGITGWWFEPHVTLKAPVIGTPEDPTMVALLTLGMSATADYFDDPYFACSNGGQAWWIKLSLPYFVNESKSLIITPSVSFNWLGRGAIKANKSSEFKRYSENPHNVPFRNFGVVAGVSCTYKF